ncbi:MAG: thiamine biosynthesis protein ThiS [Thermoanaerobaculia bacterium]
MLKVKIQGKEYKIEKVKSGISLLKKLNLIPECCILLKNGKIVDLEERFEEGDEIEIIVFGWENL